MNEEPKRSVELKEELAVELAVDNPLFREASVPLFMKDSPEGKKGNAQDEKDEMEE